MTYNNQSHITTKEEVKEFACHIINDLGIMFHPDDDFSEYVNFETGNPCFSECEAKMYNHLMEECFGVCGEDDEIYDITFPVLQKAIKKGFEPKCGTVNNVEVKYE